MTNTPSHVLLVTGSRTWDDEGHMRAAFRDLWQHWHPTRVTSPMLVSGACPGGADALAERLFRAEEFAVTTMPADWTAHGRRAGPMRNQEMVGYVTSLREQGSQIAVTAFLDLCTRAGCPRREQQLLATTGEPGHFSHGTIDYRNRAETAGLPVIDILHASLPPF